MAILICLIVAGLLFSVAVGVLEHKIRELRKTWEFWQSQDLARDAVVKSQLEFLFTSVANIQNQMTARLEANQPRPKVLPARDYGEVRRGVEKQIEDFINQE